MPNQSAVGFAGGFIQGLSDSLNAKRDRELQQSVRKQQTAQQALSLVLNSGQLGDVADLPDSFLAEAFPGVFGEQAGKRKGAKGSPDPQEIIKNVLGQSLQLQQPMTPGPQAVQPQAAPGEVGPQEDVLESRPFGPARGSTPPAARRSLFGVPLQTPDEVSARKLQQEIGGEGAKITAKIELARTRIYPALKAVDPSATLDDALSAVGVKPYQARQFAPKTLGKAVPAKDIPADAVTQAGTPVDASTADFWQPVQGASGAVFWQPGAPPTAVAKPLTGAAGEAVNEVLMGKGLDPRAVDPASPEYLDAVSEAAKLLTKDRAEKNQSRDLSQASASALLAMRNWMLGNGIGGGSGAAGADGGAGGGDVLSTLSPDEKAEAERYATYKVPLNTRAMNTPRMQKILRAATEINPSFDATNYQMRQRARIAFTTGKQGDNVRSLNTALGHLGTLADKAVARENADTKLWNTIANAGLEQTGDPRVQGFMTTAEALSSEMVNLFRGGVGAEEDVKSWRARLSASNSPQQLAEVLRTAGSLMQSRQSALETQWKSAMGDTPVDFISPDAKTGISKVDVQARKLAGGTGAQTTAAGFSVEYNGKRYTFDSQAKLDAFKRQFKIP